MRRAALLAALLAAHCGGASASEQSTASHHREARPRVVAFTRVPAGRAGFAADPRSRYPEGSRVVAADISKAGAPLVLSDGLAAAGGAAVRHDGLRIAFVGREGASDAFAVWTCAPDGSDRVRAADAGADCGSVAFLPDGRLVWSAALPEGGASALFVSGGEGRPPERITFSGGTDVDPSMLPDGRIAFASRAAGAGTFALLAVHVDGTGVGPYCGGERPHALLVRPDAHFDAALCDPFAQTVHCADVAPRRRAQGHLSVVDRTKDSGAVFCVDARTPGAASAARVRMSAGGGVLGVAGLAADGSFHVRVPADLPVTLELLDDEGGVVAAQHTPFWVRPGETRGCIGCHEEPDTAPPNVRPLAVLEDPIHLGTGRRAEGAR